VTVVCDTSVVRNFAVLGLHPVLAAVCGGRCVCVPDVVTLEDGTLGGELGDIRIAIEREGRFAIAGSGEQSTLIAAVEGLDQLAASFDAHIEVVELTVGDATLALSLSDPAQRGWRTTRHLPATPLGIGEAASMAVALRQGVALATDDLPARRTFERLGGDELFWTTDLLAKAVEAGLLAVKEADAALAMLRARYRFHAPEVSFAARGRRKPGGRSR
jgi:hypothetical protein